MNIGGSTTGSGSRSGSRTGGQGVATLVLAYAAVAALWILLSDRLLAGLGVDVGAVAWLSTAKGWVFVLATSVLLYLALVRLVRQVEEGRAVLARSEEQFRTLVEAASDAIVIVVAGRFRYANPAAAHLLGAGGAEALLGQPALDRLLPEFRSQALARLEQVESDGERLASVEFVVVRLDGTTVSVEVSVTRVVTEGERGVLVLARDITERKRIEVALRESEARFATFMAHLPGFAYIKGPDLRLLFMNPPLEAHLGLLHGAGLGRDLEASLPPVGGRAGRADDLQVLADRIPLVREERLGLEDDARTFLTTRFPIPRADGGVLLGGMALDITDRQRAERALQDLTGRLFLLQDEERRQLARELHDTTAQDLTAIGLGLTRVLQLLSAGSAVPAKAMVTECMRLVESSSRDVRTLSYLLHPPLLDELGLSAALREFVEELARRSGMPVGFACEQDFGRLEPAQEMALFRIAQECLASARRRVGSALQVVLRRRDPLAELEVSLSGAEAPAEWLSGMSDGEGGRGVGIVGMRERVRHLGGELETQRFSDRTVVRACVPVADAKQPGGEP